MGEPDDADDTRERLIAILTEPTQMSLQLSVGEISDETSLIDDLGLDSIQLLEFSIAMEEEFNIVIGELITHSVWCRFANLIALVREVRRADLVSAPVNT